MQVLPISSEMCPLNASQSTSGGFASTSASRKRSGEQHAMPSRKHAAPYSVNQICKKFNQFNGDCKFGEAMNTCNCATSLATPVADALKRKWA